MSAKHFISIDPSFTRTGYCVWKVPAIEPRQGEEHKCIVAVDGVQTTTAFPHVQRIRIICSRIEHLVTRYDAQLLVIEKPRHMGAYDAVKHRGGVDKALIHSLGCVYMVMGGLAGRLHTDQLHVEAEHSKEDKAFLATALLRSAKMQPPASQAGRQREKWSQDELDAVAIGAGALRGAWEILHGDIAKGLVRLGWSREAAKTFVDSSGVVEDLGSAAEL